MDSRPDPRREAVLDAHAEHDELAGPARQREIDRADRWRTAHGLPPLQDEDHPELELHRRARALGLRD